MNEVPMLRVNSFIRLCLDQMLKKEPKELTPFMLWGPPGVGKSESVVQVCEFLEKISKTKVVMHDVRLSLFSPVDLKGVPFPDQVEKITDWLRPRMFDLDPDPSIKHVLFFDELSYATPSVMAACYQIIQNRMCGDHEIPDNTYMLAAGNRVEDRSGAFKMVHPLANRMTHFQFEPNLEDWKQWAINAGIDQRIVSFLNFKPSLLFDFNATQDSVAFPTPRSWRNGSYFLMGEELNDITMSLLGGTVGLPAAREFKVFCNVYSELPDLSAVARGDNVKVPTRPDVLYALTGAVVGNCFEVRDDLHFRNLVCYLLKFPVEFTVIGLKDLLYKHGFKTKVAMVEEYQEWAFKNSFVGG